MIAKISLRALRGRPRRRSQSLMVDIRSDAAKLASFFRFRMGGNGLRRPSRQSRTAQRSGAVGPQLFSGTTSVQNVGRKKFFPASGESDRRARTLQFIGNFPRSAIGNGRNESLPEVDPPTSRILPGFWFVGFALFRSLAFPSFGSLEFDWGPTKDAGGAPCRAGYDRRANFSAPRLSVAPRVTASRYIRELKWASKIALKIIAASAGETI